MMILWLDYDDIVVRVWWYCG